MTTLVTYALLKTVLPGLNQQKFAPYERLINPVLTEFDIFSNLDKVHLLANVTHECRDFNDMVEGALYSSVDRILEVFPRYFNNGRDVAAAQSYVRNPQLLSRVYANRMGNGPEDSGDGYRYRGRGPIMTTGKDNYREISASGTDFVASPDLLLDPAAGLRAMGYYWKSRGCSALAARDDTKNTRIRVNGGTKGLEDVTKRVALLKRAFGISAP